MNNLIILNNAELVSRANSLTNKQRQKFLDLCLKSVIVGMAHRSSLVEHGSYEIGVLVEEFHLPLNQVLDFLGLFVAITEVFMQTHRSQFRNALQVVGFSQEFIDGLPFQDSDAVSVLLNFNDGIENLLSCNWRIDISFSCGYQTVLQGLPTILMAIRVTNGMTYIIELNIKNFARLRFLLSFIIKEFNKVKKRALLKC